jgi:hypothetical protein
MRPGIWLIYAVSAVREIALSSAYGPVLARLQYECGRPVVTPGGWVDSGRYSWAAHHASSGL